MYRSGINLYNFYVIASDNILINNEFIIIYHIAVCFLNNQ